MATEPNHTGDCPDEIESVEEEELAAGIAHNILKYPDVIAALQSQRIAEMLAALPPPVQRRIKALKRMQQEATAIEAKFFEEVHALECKYHQQYTPLYEKRHLIVTGVYEPTDEESEWHSDDDEGLTKGLEDKVKIEDVNDKKEAPPKDDLPTKGIPDFWLTIFKNVSLLSDMVKEQDEPILKHLTDIKLKFSEKPMGFVLEFHFEPNEYFTNTVLTKEYDMKCEPDEDDPFCFEGPEIYRCRGCIIHWNKGKNVTLRTVKKKQKHKSRGLIRTVTKTIQNESFFNFFSPPTIPEDANEDEVDETTRNTLTGDYEIGHYIRERIVPRAILYYTGEGIEDEDYEEEEEEEDEDEDSDGKESPEAQREINDQNCKQQ